MAEKQRILIVDDDANIAELISLYLMKECYETMIVGDGEEATVDEAMPVMEKYLDDAYLAHLTTVRVVHGRGTGALKNAVHTRLKKLKYVKEFRLGVFGEGDSGVTIVTFK